MKTNTAPRQVKISAAETAEFTIKANGKAFRALISGLYENKIQSIVREIWSNALDAHISAGKADTPFSVTFPTMYNPAFVVRDYGTSLDHGDVMHLYSTVFESTKEDTNDETGKFGLGSKSPFAYTDTFSVVAVKDGQKRHYSAVIGTDGIPCIHFLGSEASNDPQGLEVSFPIQTSDISKFRREARRISLGFDVKPDVIKHEEDDAFDGWATLDIVTEGSDWKLLKNRIEGYSDRAYAKMGPVLYPINANVVDDLTEAERSLINANIIIDFDMGELEMTPSREALSYGAGDPTIPSLRAKLRRIVTEMVATFQKEYDACASFWEACVAHRAHINGSAPSAIRSALTAKAHWKGQKLAVVKKFESNDIPGLSITTLESSKLNNAMYRFKTEPEPSIAYKNNTIIYIEEEGYDKRAPSKIKYDVTQERVDNKKVDTVIWIRSRRVHPRYAPPGAAESIGKFYDAIDGADIRLVSELTDPPRIAGSSSGGTYRPVQVRQFDGHDFDRRTTVDYEEGGYYVPLERMEPQYPSGMHGPRAMWEALRAVGVVPTEAILYGAPKSLWKKFEGENWINIYDLAPEAFKASKPKASLAKRALIQSVRSNSMLRWLADVGKSDKFSEGPAKEAMEYYETVTGYKQPQVEGFILLARALGKNDLICEWSEFDSSEVDYHVEALKVYYPLLTFIRDNTQYSTSPVDKIIEYVQMCDNAAESQESAKSTTAAAA